MHLNHSPAAVEAACGEFNRTIKWRKKRVVGQARLRSTNKEKGGRGRLLPSILPEAIPARVSAPGTGL
jgi:hypothetical protein